MRSNFRQRGVSLVELMVAIFLGMLIVLTISGSAIFLEAQKRQTVGANSALENGAMGIFQIEHDVRMAGLGFLYNGQFNCPSVNIYKSSTKANTQVLFPVIATDGGTTGSDSLTVLYGDSPTAAVPTTLAVAMSSPTDVIKPVSTASLHIDQYAVLMGANADLPCTVVGVTSITGTGYGALVYHDTSSVYNPSAPASSFTTAPSYPQGSVVQGLLSSNWVTWQVLNNKLQQVDNISGATLDIADNIVQMHVQYGISSAAGVSTISDWVSPSGTWAAPTAAQRLQIRAVRVGLVARSAQAEKPPVGSSTCTTTTSAPVLFAGTRSVTAGLTAATDWKCYRYRTVETTIPLKNLIMSGAV